MKYSSSFLFKDEYFRKDSIIVGVIPFLHKISVPIRLKTILQIAQLTAFLTSNSSSNNNFFSPSNVYGMLIFYNPEG